MSELTSPGETAKSRKTRTAGYAARLALREAPKPVITWVLVAVNIGVFVWMWLTGAQQRNGYFDFGVNYGPATLNQRWRFISCGFIHLGALHLLFNAMALVDFGAILERVVGRWMFLVVYFVSLLGSSIVSYTWSTATFSAGASGAILGLAGYLFVCPPIDPGTNQPIGGYRRYMLIWFGTLFVLGLWLPLDNAGHLGGLLTGAVIGFVCQAVATSRAQLAKQFLGVAAVLASLAALVLYGDRRVLADPELRARVHYLKGIGLLEDNQNRAALTELNYAVELSGAAPMFECRAVARLRLGDREGAIADALSGYKFYDEEARDRPWVPPANSSRAELRELQNAIRGSE